MKAMVVTRFGGPEVLEPQTLPDPVPGDGDVLIEVHAAALNPVDTKIRSSGRGQTRTFPFVLGFDVSGVVASVGKNVSKFKIGDEVYASPALNRDGSNAELVVVDHQAVAHKPGSLDHIQAAALPLVTITAWEAMFKRAHLHHGQTVLIHAGAGGVGHVAIQLAKYHGCRVITTASRDESIEFCKGLGADVVINYKNENVVQRVQDETEGKGCPVVFETVGGKNFDISIPLVAVHGHLVSILGAPQDAPLSHLFYRDASVHFEYMGSSALFGTSRAPQGEILHTAAEMVDAGKLKPHVQEVFALEDLRAAHEKWEQGHTTGKIAIRVK